MPDAKPTEYAHDLKMILTLKRTANEMGNTMNWHEIAKRLGMKSGQLAHYHMLRLTHGETFHRCPCCLQKLLKAKEANEHKQSG